MKKIFTLILACMAIALPLKAQDSNGNSTPEPIILKSLPLDNHPTTPIHRAPIRVEALILISHPIDNEPNPTI